jgi:hypothetical protein
MSFRGLPGKPVLSVISILVLSVVYIGRAHAQVSGASLTGTVKDASGSIIPNAEVSIIDVATGVGRAVTTDAAGLYTAPNLSPGTYDVKVSASGFSTMLRKGITLTVGGQQLLDITMTVGQVNQTVEVTTEAPQVDLVSSSITGIVNQTTVVELPLNGRDWTQLATLQPAVNLVLTQQPNGVTASRGNRGFGAQLSVAGSRPQLNNYRLDGMSIVDYAGGGPGSVLGIALGVDAVAEFSVLTSNSDAEYGRTAGGVINAITKSGTNQFHGDAYEFIRNSALDAKNFFDNTTIPPFRRNQFGGAVGGPIFKNKTFFFVDYEGFRQALGSTNVDIVPSQAARNGNIHDSGGNPITVSVSPLVSPFFAFYPLPNAGLIGNGDTGHYDIATTNVASENFVTTRIDHKFSDRDSISGTYFLDKGINSSPDVLDTWLIGNTSYRSMITLSENHAFSSSLVNSLRVGYDRVQEYSNTAVSSINPLAANTTPTYSANPGEPPPSVKVTGLTTFAGGLGELSAPDHTWNSYQIYDDVFLTKGNHSIKFGGTVERMQHQVLISGGLNGLFSFGSLQSFLTDAPSSFTINGPRPEFGIRQTLVGGYVQDDWRLRANLTVNLGLRYEMVTVPNEVHNSLSNLPSFSAPPPGNLGSPYFSNPTKRNFEPRIGFAWDPFHNGKTSVRGAFGIFDLLPLNYEFFVAEGNSEPYAIALSQSNSSLLANAFPGGAINTVNTSALAAASIQTNPPRNYAMTWNLNIQNQITSSLAASIGYVGSHGVHMENKTDDVNMVMPTLTPSGYLWPSPIGSGTKINPLVGQLRDTYWGGDSFYDALEAQVTKKLSHGFQVQGSYTWGKSIDTGSASVIGDPFTNSITSLLEFCNTCRRGPSDFNIGQTLIISYIWEIPTPKNWGSVSSHLLGGWELGGIFTAESGLPFTPLIGGAALGQNSTDPFDYPDRVACSSLINTGNVQHYVNASCFALPAAPASLAAQCVPFGTKVGTPIAGTCQNLMGNSSRNSVVGPGLINLDFSLFKNNYIPKISETFNAQFRVEAFNILNHPNFGVPVDNSTFFNVNGGSVGGAGSLDNTSTPSREIQFALKLIF